MAGGRGWGSWVKRGAGLEVVVCFEPPAVWGLGVVPHIFASPHLQGGQRVASLGPNPCARAPPTNTPDTTPTLPLLCPPGSTQSLYVLTKYHNQRFEFIFTATASESATDSLFASMQGVFRAYDSSRLYRDLKLRGVC